MSGAQDQPLFRQPSVQQRLEDFVHVSSQPTHHPYRRQCCSNARLSQSPQGPIDPGCLDAVALDLRDIQEIGQFVEKAGTVDIDHCSAICAHLLHAECLWTPSRIGVVRKRAHFAPTPASDAQTPIKQPVHELQRITLQVVSGTVASRLWNEYVARYHYLGYTPMSGSQIRYNVFAGEQLVACISFGACAWKLKDREKFIGWSEEQRQKNLQLVVNNARFLVLPWIESKGLASKILSLAARQLPIDWLNRYGFRPVLLETFVEYERHRGTCYKAANWINVGRTAGRGKKSISHKKLIPAKDIWLYPLRKNFAAELCQ